jgi:hypothetical protein
MGDILLARNSHRVGLSWKGDGTKVLIYSATWIVVSFGSREPRIRQKQGLLGFFIYCHNFMLPYTPP